MKIGPFDTKNGVLVIAEVGNNHEGNYSVAEELVGLAAEAGVDAIKFQTFKTELFLSPKNEVGFKRLKKFELSYENFENLARAAKKAGLLFISTPLDLESAAFLEPLVASYKIASGDNNFFPLMEVIANTGKPVILSSGMATPEQLRQSKQFIEKIWTNRGITQELAVLHCVSSYPVPAQEANLGAIRELSQELGGVIGYSDHTLGINAAVLSVALGARIIEKHFTLRKDYSEFRDHQLSADPKDMAELVKRVREAEQLLGTGRKTVQPSEQVGVQAYRRSIVAKKDLVAGEKIRWEDLSWLRPANGLLPGQESLVIGRAPRKAIKAGELILADDLS